MSHHIKLSILCVGLVSLFGSLAPAVAEDTGVWTAGQVTYSISRSSIEVGPGTDPLAIAVSQFNAATAASRLGGDAAGYTLTGVILSIDSSVSGTFWYRNTSTTTRNVSVEFAGGGSLDMYGSSTGVETFGQTVNLGAVAAGNETTYNFNLAGSGLRQTSLSDGLAEFLGSGDVYAYADYTSLRLTPLVSGSNQTQTDWQASAQVTVTYTFDYNVVPEPSSALLFGAGAAVLLLRRRARHTRAR